MTTRPRLHPAETLLAVGFLILGGLLLFSILRTEVWYYLHERSFRAGVRLYGLLSVVSGLCLLLQVRRFTIWLQWIGTLGLGFLALYFWGGQFFYFAYKDTLLERLSWAWPGLLAAPALTALHFAIGRWLKSLESLGMESGKIVPGE